MSDHDLTSGEVALQLGVRLSDVLAALRRNPALEPRRVGQLRVWSASDVERLRKALAGRICTVPGGRAAGILRAVPHGDTIRT